jgi:hypothetical protein
MNSKQKTVIGFGLAVVIAMALYPPWATWCPVDDRDLQVQYGWLFGRVNYPECAEKLSDWTWGLASDRLLLQWGVAIVATVALTVAFQSTETGRTKRLISIGPIEIERGAESADPASDSSGRPVGRKTGIP